MSLVGGQGIGGAWVIGPCPICEELGLPGWQLDVLPAVRARLGFEELARQLQEALEEHDAEAHPGELALLAERIREREAEEAAEVVVEAAADRGREQA